MALHALWWWIDRWRKSTAYTDMTLEQQGAYRNLLDEATLRGGPLPTDERVLAKACGDPRKWKRVRPIVLAHFTLMPDGWRNATLDSVLARSEELRLARVEAGRRGGRAKASNASETASNDPSKPLANGLAKPLANTLAKSWHPSPSPSDGSEPVEPVETPAAPVLSHASRLAKEPADDGNYRVILKLAHEVIEVSAPDEPTEADLVELLKAACAQRKIKYNAHRVLTRALEAASRTHRGSVALMAADLRRASPAELGPRLKALAQKGRS